MEQFQKFTARISQLRHVLLDCLLRSNLADWNPRMFTSVLTQMTSINQQGRFSREEHQDVDSGPRFPPGGASSAAAKPGFVGMYEKLLRAMLSELIGRASDERSVGKLHELEISTLSHLLQAIQEFGLPANEPGINVILRCLGERAQATIAAAEANEKRAAMAAAAASNPSTPLQPFDDNDEADVQSALESELEMQARFFASDSEQTTPSHHAPLAPAPAVAKLRSASAPFATPKDASPSSAAISSPPPFIELDVTSISFCLEALTRLGRLTSESATGTDNSAPSASSVAATTAQQEIETVWKPVATALSTMTLQAASARDIGVILSTLPRVGAIQPKLLHRLANRVTQLDAGAIAHPRAYANLITGFGEAGFVRLDLWSHLYQCLHHEFTLRRAALGDSGSPAAGADGSAGASSAQPAAGRKGQRPTVVVTKYIGGLRSEESGGEHRRTLAPFRVPQLICVFTRCTPALAAQGAELMQLALPLLLNAFRDQEKAMEALSKSGSNATPNTSTTTVPSPQWYAAAAEIVHAYAVLCHAASRMHAAVGPLFDAAASSVTSILQAHHRSPTSLVAAGSTMTSDPAGAAVTSDPFYVSMITLLISSFGAQQHRAPAMFAVAATQLEALLLYGNPVHSKVVPTYLSTCLMAIGNSCSGASTDSLRPLFSASAFYVRWLLRSSRLSNSLSPGFYSGTVDAFRRVGVHDRALLIDIANYLVGPSDAASSGNSNSASASAAGVDRYGRRPERRGGLQEVAESPSSSSMVSDGAESAVIHGSQASVYVASLSQPVVRRAWGLGGFHPKQLSRLREAFVAAGVHHERLITACLVGEGLQTPAAQPSQHHGQQKLQQAVSSNSDRNVVDSSSSNGAAAVIVATEDSSTASAAATSLLCRSTQSQ